MELGVVAWLQVQMHAGGMHGRRPGCCSMGGRLDLLVWSVPEVPERERSSGLLAMLMRPLQTCMPMRALGAIHLCGHFNPAHHQLCCI